MPDELKPAYKQMQAAFTKKTQEIANAKKEAEALKARADAYSKVEQYIPVIEEMLTKGPQSPARAEAESPEMAALASQLKQAGYSDEAVDLGKTVANFMLGTVNQTLSAEKAQAQLEAKVYEAESIDPRLNDQSLTYTLPDGTTATFGEVVAKLTTSDPNWTQDPVAATKRSIAYVDALVNKAKSEGKEELSASAKAKAQKFPNLNSSPQSAANAGQALSFAEAAAQAREEVGV